MALNLNTDEPVLSKGVFILSYYDFSAVDPNFASAQMDSIFWLRVTSISSTLSSYYVCSGSTFPFSDSIPKSGSSEGIKFMPSNTLPM